MSDAPPPKPPVSSDKHAPAPAPASSGGGVVAVIVVVLIAVVLVSICVVGGLAALLIPAVGTAREAARRAGSMNNVKQLAIGIMNYEASYGKFPPQYTVDEEGQPLHSWRTLLLPYIEESILFDQIDMDEPWNSDVNFDVIDHEAPLFRSPRYGDSGNLTNYVAIAGEGFLFDGEKQRTMDDIKDGMSNTILIVEIANSDIQWAEPRDLTLDSLQLEDTGASPDAVNVIRSGAIVGYADGHVVSLQGASPEMLRSQLTIGGGEPGSF